MRARDNWAPPKLLTADPSHSSLVWGPAHFCVNGQTINTLGFVHVRTPLQLLNGASVMRKDLWTKYERMNDSGYVPRKLDLCTWELQF